MNDFHIYARDGQAVFADLEKVYLYRYVFTKGTADERPFSGLNIEGIPDREVYVSPSTTGLSLAVWLQ